MDEFFYYLVDYVNGYGYEDMLEVLYYTPFESRNHIDNNLLISAREFRESRSMSHQYPGNCFEIFIQLAIRMDDILYDSHHGHRIEEWFWLMMRNMGLIVHDNEHCDISIVENIIEKFINKKYKKDGTGGPFPLDRPLRNVRQVSLWMQLNWYINEQFEYEFNNLESEEDYNE